MVTIATAQVDVSLNKTQLNQQVKSLQSDLNKSISRYAEGIGNASRALSNALKVIATPVIGAGLGAVYKFLKSSDAQAQLFNSKLKGLSNAMAELGGRILQIPIFGKTAFEWVDTLTQKIRSLSDKELKNIVKMAQGLVITLGALKGISLSADLVKQLAKLGTVLSAQAAVNSVGSCVVQGVGVAGGFGGAKALGALAVKLYGMGAALELLIIKFTAIFVGAGVSLKFVGESIGRLFAGEGLQSFVNARESIDSFFYKVGRMFHSVNLDTGERLTSEGTALPSRDERRRLVERSKGMSFVNGQIDAIEFSDSARIGDLGISEAKVIKKSIELSLKKAWQLFNASSSDIERADAQKLIGTLTSRLNGVNSIIDDALKMAMDQSYARAMNNKSVQDRLRGYLTQQYGLYTSQADIKKQYNNVGKLIGGTVNVSSADEFRKSFNQGQIDYQQKQEEFKQQREELVKAYKEADKEILEINKEMLKVQEDQREYNKVSAAAAAALDILIKEN